MLDFKKYDSKKIGILGLGMTGQSIFNSLSQSKAEIFLWDDNVSIREKSLDCQAKIKIINDGPWE